MVHNNNADSYIAIDDGVKHIKKFADVNGIKNKRSARYDQRGKIERENLVLNNAGNQGNTEKVNGKIKIDIEEMFFDVQPI